MKNIASATRSCLVWAFAFALVFAVSLAAGQGKPLVSVRFADQIGSEADYANVWVADALGYFAEEGIKIDRKTFSNGPEGLLHLANGEIDMMVGGLAPFMQAAARGQDFKMLMSVTKYNAPLVGKRDFKAYKDLNGKVVGSPGLGTVQDAVLSYVEKTQNIKFKRVFAKVSDFGAMVDKGEIDAFVSWEPAAATALKLNAKLHYIAQLPPIKNAESLELIAQPQFVKDYPQAIAGFVRATLRGIEWIKKNPREKTAEIVAKKMNDPTAVPVVLNAMDSIVVTDPRVDMPSTRIILQTIADAGKIPPEYVKDIDGWIGKYIDYSYLERAEKSLK
jgi:NitT/TauT family transport system substrate-binding protein